MITATHLPETKIDKLSSLTIFFPFFNDAGTVKKQIDDAYLYGKEFTDDLEVIAIHGGNSSDDTWEVILGQKKIYPSLKIIDRSDNKEGYAVIKHGFYTATKKWVFYTDGDAQYHLTDLHRLVAKVKNRRIDIVNGYKTNRNDNIFRIIFGEGYRHFAKWIFDLPIRDTDCDFRLIKNSFMSQIKLESPDASILTEMILKLHQMEAKFTEVPVRHYPRVYGKSNYTVFSLTKEKLIGDFRLFLKLHRQSLRISKFNYLKVFPSFLFIAFHLSYKVFLRSKHLIAALLTKS